MTTLSPIHTPVATGAVDTDSEGDMPPTMSVVMAVAGGTADLDEALGSLAEQKVDGDFEVLLSDNGADGLPGFVERWTPRIPRIRIVESRDRRGAAHARNVAVRETRGEQVVFFDSDDIMEPGYLAAMHAALLQAPLVCARIDLKTLNDSSWAIHGGHEQQDGPIRQELGFLPFAGAGTIGIRRELFLSLHGFDEHLLAYEEADLCWRAQLNEKVPPPLHVPDAVLLYRLRGTLKGRWHQSQRYGEAQVELYRRFGDVGMPRRSIVRGVLSAFKSVPRCLLLMRTPGGRWTAAAIAGTTVGRWRATLRGGAAYL